MGIGRQNLDNLSDNIYEALKGLHRPGALLVDIGANTGQTLIKWLAVSGAEARYCGFDINAQCVAYVERLIKANKMANAIALPVGLGPSLELASLAIGSDIIGVDPGASTNSDLRPSSFYTSSKQGVVVEASPMLKAVTKDSTDVIIKLDIEGSELQVLQAMASWLADQSASLSFIIEILPPHELFPDNVNAYRVETKREIFALMRQYGYEGSPLSTHGKGSQVGTKDTDFLFKRVQA
jgi:FkbM family methyltransferase